MQPPRQTDLGAVHYTAGMRTAPPFSRANAAPRVLITAAAVLTAVGMAPRAALGIEQLQLDLGNLSGEGWQAENVHLALQLDGRAQLTVQRLRLPEPLEPLRDVTLQCRRLVLDGEQVQCAKGELRAAESPLGTDPMPVSFRYRFPDQALSLQLREAAFADGQLDLELALQQARWRVTLDGRALDAAALAARVPALAPPEGTRLDASLDVSGELLGTGAELQQADLRLRTAAAAFASADGRNAAEQLALQAELRARAQGADWLLDGQLAASRGTVCVGPCWDLPQQPVSLRFEGRWRHGTRLLEVTSFHYQDVGALEASGSFHYAPFAPSPWPALDVQVASADAGHLYRAYLQPSSIGTVLEDLTVSGRLDGHVAKSSTGGWSVQARLQELSFQDRAARFGLRGVNGTLAWNNGADAEPSRLRWQGGNLYQIPVGAAGLRFEADAQSMRLLEAASVPVFDGSLEVARFAVQHPGSDAMRWDLDAVLTPIAMQDFSRAMGWPEMAGRLSGVIPSLRYAEHRLAVEGVLLIRAFDGDVTIRDLQIDDLLGVVPTLNADIRLRSIDLQQLTGTFSFGRIEGRLEGGIDGLVLQNWRPVAFDARFATPENDPSRHRISQRAVDNLTSLGGGVGGALSRSFLRFFDDFSYDRLGVSCRLKNGVCEMGGIAPAPEGYYIVKGGGLPRIDVIGYQRRVDWPVLLKRLEGVTGGGGPVIR